jgi:hypothetical protein
MSLQSLSVTKFHLFECIGGMKEIFVSSLDSGSQVPVRKF